MGAIALNWRRNETLDFKSFVNGEKVRKLKNNKAVKYVVYFSQATGLFMLVAPGVASAQSKDDTFNDLWRAVMGIVDWLAVGVFVFAGTSWMFGHRTKAIELIIGGCCGYLLARHALEIVEFLKGIGSGGGE